MRRAEGPPHPAGPLTLTELRSKSFLATVFRVVCYTTIDTLQDQGEIRPGGEKKKDLEEMPQIPSGLVTSDTS